MFTPTKQAVYLHEITTSEVSVLNSDKIEVGHLKVKEGMDDGGNGAVPYNSQFAGRSGLDGRSCGQAWRSTEIA